MTGGSAAWSTQGATLVVAQGRHKACPYWVVVPFESGTGVPPVNAHSQEKL